MKKMIDKVALLLIRSRRVLFVRSKNKDTFYTLGGKRDPGETDQQVVVRETREEIDAAVIVDSLRYFETFNDVVHTDVETPLKLTCYLGEIIGDPSPSSEIEEMAWLDTGNSGSYKLTKTGMGVLASLKRNGLID